MDVFRQMEAAGIVPDVMAHNAAIAACAKARRRLPPASPHASPRRQPGGCHAPRARPLD